MYKVLFPPSFIQFVSYLILFDSVMPNMADRCRIVIEAVLKYAQELLGCNSNTNLPADLKVLSHSPKNCCESVALN